MHAVYIHHNFLNALMRLSSDYPKYGRLLSMWAPFYLTLLCRKNIPHFISNRITLGHHARLAQVTFLSVFLVPISFSSIQSSINTRFSPYFYRYLPYQAIYWRAKYCSAYWRGLYSRCRFHLLDHLLDELLIDRSRTHLTSTSHIDSPRRNSMSQILYGTSRDSTPIRKEVLVDYISGKMIMGLVPWQISIHLHLQSV